jgi:ferric-dicitrate binding protein FerR (iron transport regulator)
MKDEEDVTAQLLRLAGAPPDPPAERTARVRAAVHGDWRTRRQRRTIRNGAAIGLLAAAASVATAVWMRGRVDTPAANPPGIAVAQRTQGHPFIDRPSLGAGAMPLATSAPIYPDDVIDTDAESRVGLQLTDGSSIRIDRGSRVRFVTPTVLQVIAGAAYVATAEHSHGFEVRTAMGTLRDIGTRFEVRVTPTLLRLRVRAGTVEIRRGTVIDTAAAGTEATVSTTGIAVRPVPAYGVEWAWTTDVAPAFAIEGRTLESYLAHVAAEQGWTVRYADATVAQAAARNILHGSVEGLSAEDALSVVLATSGLDYHLRGGDLSVSRTATAR